MDLEEESIGESDSSEDNPGSRPARRRRIINKGRLARARAKEREKGPESTSMPAKRDPKEPLARETRRTSIGRTAGGTLSSLQATALPKQAPKRKNSIDALVANKGRRMSGGASASASAATAAAGAPSGEN